MEVESKKEGKMIESFTLADIRRIANMQAHEAAVKWTGSGDYERVHQRIFNYLFRKLLMPDTEETPGWVVRLANYFTRDSEIDDVKEETGRSEDPLNEAEYVTLTIRFKRNGSGRVTSAGQEVVVERETIGLNDDD